MRSSTSYSVVRSRVAHRVGKHTHTGRANKETSTAFCESAQQQQLTALFLVFFTLGDDGRDGSIGKDTNPKHHRLRTKPGQTENQTPNNPKKRISTDTTALPSTEIALKNHDLTVLLPVEVFSF